MCNTPKTLATCAMDGDGDDDSDGDDNCSDPKEEMLPTEQQNTRRVTVRAGPHAHGHTLPVAVAAFCASYTVFL